MSSPALLIGPLTIDHYLDEGLRLPGGGVVNMAYHWATLGRAVVLVGRFGVADTDVFAGFAARHGIALSADAAVAGVSSSIDIEFRSDGQPWMDGFVEGVNAELRLTAAEVAPIAAGAPTHAVLVDVVDAEVRRLADTGLFEASTVSGDFLDFRHMTTARFRATAAALDLAFVGWPGDPDDPQVDELLGAADDLGVVLVVTLGSRGVIVADGRSGIVERFPVEAVPVVGTTVGCGDAFIAAFLDDWYRHADISRAVDAGRRLGAAATVWRRPLPDAAYG